MYSLPSTNIYYAYKNSVKVFIDTENNRNIGGTFRFCVDIIYRWIYRKFSEMDLPSYVQPLHISLITQNVDVIYLPHKMYFCMRTVHQDNSNPKRFWITEAEILNINGELNLGVRNSYTAPEPDNNLLKTGIPNFMKELQNKCILLDGEQKTGFLHDIKTQEDLEKLFDLILESSRLLPVIVISQNNKMDKEWSTFFEVDDGYLVDGAKLATELVLRAHVFYLPLDLQEQWTKLVGQEWNIFNGAVRTYYPNASFDNSEYYSHPYTLASRILAMEYTTCEGRLCIGGHAFRHILCHRIETDNVCHRIDWEKLGHKFYFRIFREQYQSKKENDDEKEYYKALDDENDRLREEQSENRRTLDIYEVDLEQVRNDIQKYISINYANQARIRSLETQLEVLRGQKLQMSYPTEYEEIPQWVGQYFSGKIELSSRALKSLKTAVYSDIELVGKALELLATEYYDMRLGNGTKEDFDEKLGILYLKDELAISDSSAGEQGGEYYIVHNGSKRKFDKHLVKGSGRDPRDCLRIYYFWDNDSGMVVIGNLPDHLSIRSSN